MYSKVKKLKQQDLFDNSLSMPVGKKCHAIGLLRLVQWAFVFGVSEFALRGFKQKFRLYVTFSNGRKFHSRWLVSKNSFYGSFIEPIPLVEAYFVMKLLYWKNHGEKIFDEYISFKVQRLCRYLKKSRIH